MNKSHTLRCLFLIISLDSANSLRIYIQMYDCKTKKKNVFARWPIKDCKRLLYLKKKHKEINHFSYHPTSCCFLLVKKTVQSSTNSRPNWLCQFNNSRMPILGLWCHGRIFQNKSEEDINKNCQKCMLDYLDNINNSFIFRSA